MTICDPLHCPFLGCASCEYAGGVDPSAGTVFAGQRAKMGVRKTAPDECANTPEGLTTNDCVGVAMASPNHTRTTPPRGKNRGGV